MNQERLQGAGLTALTWLLALLSVSPFYIVASNSLKTQKGIFMDLMGLPFGQYFNPKNYVEAFEKLDFFKSLFNSLLITTISTCLIILFTSMAAWMLVRMKSKVSSFVYYFLAASMLIPFQAVMLPLINWMGKLHLLNPGGLIFMYLGFGSSMAIILYHGFIKGIPLELEEAARIDGCNTFQTYFFVVFPLLQPITVTVAILNVMWIWNDFLLPQLVINRPEWHTIPLKMFYFFGQYSKKWHLALAGLVIAMVPIILFYFFMQKQIVKGITQGSIK